MGRYVQALDLSFNCLDSASIVSLGSLPCLNYLDVSGNPHMHTARDIMLLTVDIFTAKKPC